MPKNNFIIFSEYAESEGLEVVGGNNKTAIVRDQEGVEYDVDIEAMKKAEGIDNDVEIQLNTPSKALAKSPLSITDRAALSTGNAPGKLSYLKRKFEDAKFDPESGFVVKKDGAWHQVDPSVYATDDPWELASELAKDAADWFGDVPVIAGGALGGGAGLVAGAPSGPGAVATSVAGATLGSGAGEAVRTVLGKVLGTYEASTEEQLKDIAIESALGMGGQIAGLGLRAGFGSLRKGLKTVAKKAAPEVKGLYSQIFGTTTGVKKEAMEVALEQTDDVVNKLARNSRRFPDVGDMQSNLQEQIAKKSTQFLDKARDNLTSRYGKVLEDVFEQAEVKNLTVNMGEVVENSIRSLERQGLGKVTTNQAGKLTFQAFDASDVASRLRQGLPVEAVSARDAAQVNRLVRGLDSFKEVGNLKGKAAARALGQFQKTINRNFQAFQAEPQLKRIGSIASAEARNTVGDKFTQAGLGERWAEANTLYSQFANSVKEAEKILARDGAEQFADRLLASSVAGRKAQGLAKQLIELGGKGADDLYNDIVTDETARRFATWLPNMGIAQTASQFGVGGAGAAGFMLGGPAGAAGAAATAATAASPRGVLKTIPYAVKGLDFIKSLGEGEMETLLKNPNMFRAFAQTVAGSGIEEAEQTEMLLQNSGVVPNGQR